MKKYVVTDEERKICDSTVDRLKGSSQKARRTRIPMALTLERRDRNFLADLEDVDDE